MRAWESDGDFRAAIETDAAVQKYLKKGNLEHSFSLDRQLTNVDAIFHRVFEPQGG